MDLRVMAKSKATILDGDGIGVVVDGGLEINKSSN